VLSKTIQQILTRIVFQNLWSIRRYSERKHREGKNVSTSNCSVPLKSLMDSLTESEKRVEGGQWNEWTMFFFFFVGNSIFVFLTNYYIVCRTTYPSGNSMHFSPVIITEQDFFLTHTLLHMLWHVRHIKLLGLVNKSLHLVFLSSPQPNRTRDVVKKWHLPTLGTW